MTVACDGENPTYPSSPPSAGSNHDSHSKKKEEYSQNCTELPSPPDAVGMKSELQHSLLLVTNRDGRSTVQTRILEGKGKKERRTATRPVESRTWVAIHRAGEVRERSERRDLSRTENGDALPLRVELNSVSIPYTKGDNGV